MANEHIEVGSYSYQKMKNIKYLCSLLTNQNSIQEEMKYKFKARNLRYYLVQTSFSSRLPSKNL